MSRNYCDDISPRFLAERNSGAAKLPHFITSFKKMYYEPSLSHILRLRIAKAKILLRNLDLQDPMSQKNAGLKSRVPLQTCSKPPRARRLHHRTDRDSVASFLL